MKNKRNIKISVWRQCDNKCERRDAQPCAVFWNVVDLPDQPGRGEIGDAVRAPGTRAVARGQVDSGSERGLKSRELVDDRIFCIQR